MKTWFISRHPGALHWMKRNNIAFDEHISHLDPCFVQKGDKVVGSLPVHLAAEICAKGAEYWNLSLNIPKELRGYELSAEQLEQFSATLEKYNIQLDIESISSIEPDIPAVNEKVNTLKPRFTPKTPTETANVNTSSWLDEVFRLHAWGDNNAQRILDNYLTLSEQLISQQPTLRSRLQTVARQGKAALELNKERKTIFLTQGRAKARAFINELKQQGRSNRIIHHLDISQNKDVSFIKNKAQQKPAYNYTPKMPYMQLIDGRHPQSIRNLKPSQKWTVLIDESGSQFGVDHDGTNERDIGKLVALVMPESCKLKPMKLPFHATKASMDAVEQVITAITQSNCGVFGASFDGVITAYSWMAGIDQFIRLLLSQLPMNTTQHTKVDIYIENRSHYGNSQQLLALNEAIESDMKRLSPNTFANLHLHLSIMDKNDPFNGYVDAIANCWGSNVADKRKLLARTLWRGHCLLQRQLLGKAERLYQSIVTGTVAPTDWFNFCDYAASEPKHSLLNNMLNELGEQVQNDEASWLRFLNEIQYQMQSKNYNAGSLYRALDWLHQYQPNKRELPRLLELQLLSGRLAAENHQGITNIPLAGKVISLADSLINEAPAEACQAILRIAMSATHSFDFTSPEMLIERWLTYPIAVPGLLNHAKLHSTKGQFLAFQKNHGAALESFNNALQLFELLSDTNQAQRESQQTKIYKAVTMMDAKHPQAVSYTQELLLGNPLNQGKRYVATLAKSINNLQRFEHYLLLRLLTHYPQLSKERDTYLAEQEHWEQGEGHPWMLINAYRGWLLAESGNREDAMNWFKQAIDDCTAPENSAILQWMGLVLHALSTTCGIELPTPNIEMTNTFPISGLSQLAHSQQNNQERLNALNTLLPFNFH